VFKIAEIHNQPEILILPKGVCGIPTILINNKCRTKEDCKYFEGCTNAKKGKKYVVTK